jgi:hypothetical protein
MRTGPIRSSPGIEQADRLAGFTATSLIPIPKVRQIRTDPARQDLAVDFGPDRAIESGHNNSVRILSRVAEGTGPTTPQQPVHFRWMLVLLPARHGRLDTIEAAMSWDR